MFFSMLSVCHLLPKQLTTHCHDYRFYSNKRRGAYLIFVSPMRRLFEGGAYLKGSYHKDKTFWLYNLIYFMSIFFMAFFTQELMKNAKILKRQLNERASR